MHLIFERANTTFQMFRSCGSMETCALLLFLLLFGYSQSFITPSKSEPACPGVKCKTFDPNTCRCICDPEPCPECPGVKCKTFDPNTCKCLCDLEISCTESGSLWPLGNYGLPASIYGCPEVTWPMKYINMTMSSNGKDMFWKTSGISYYDIYRMENYTFKDSLQILGPYDRKTMQLNFCVREDGDFNSLSNLHGNFCIYKVETHQCIGGYYEGSITIKGYHADVRGFRTNITTNDGGVVVSFCCRNDSNSTLSDVLPHTYPFVLLAGPNAKTCENVADMTVTEDVVYFTQVAQFDFSGTLPNMTITDTHVGIRFCVYQPGGYRDILNTGTAKPLDVVSIGRPVYSSPYEQFPWKNPNSVVDGDTTVQFATFFDNNIFGWNRHIKSYSRLWLQIDLQQFVQIQQIIIHGLQGYTYDVPNIVGLYVSRDQWDFVHHGAFACFLGPQHDSEDRIALYICGRPVIGQYFTLVFEQLSYHAFSTSLAELSIYGQATGCGRQLGMISGDIKEYQIETSSNYKDIQYSRALQGTKGWCTNTMDKERWIMIDLIMATTVQCVALHGLYLGQRMFINSFRLIYGVNKRNMTMYADLGNDPKVFTIDTSQDVFALQKFWFLTDIVARFIKIQITEPNAEIACLKLEVIGCPVYGSRNIMCNDKLHFDKVDFPLNDTMVDFGFASIHHMTVRDLLLSGSSKNTLEACQQSTVVDDYIGNVYHNDSKQCNSYLVSSTNRHYKNFWHSVDDSGYIVSERLCFNELTHINDILQANRSYNVIPEKILHLYSPLFPSNYPKGNTAETIICSPNGTFIQLTITYLSLAQSATKRHLQQANHPEINPGDCQDTITIDVGTGNMVKLTRDNQKRYRHSTFMSSGSYIRIKLVSCFQYLTSLDDYVYEFQAKVIDRPGCGIDGTSNVTCTVKTAYLASVLYPAFSTSSRMHLWKIQAKYGQYIELQFVDLDVNSVSFVEVFDIDLKGKRSSMGRFFKETNLKVKLFSSWHMMDLEFRASNLTGRGFLGIYSIKNTHMDMINEKSNCNDTWYHFKNSCYKLFPQPNIYSTQTTAESKCLSYGGHLVTVNSKDEMLFVHQLLIKKIAPANVIEQIYIGLKKRNKGYQWSDYYWLNGEPMIYTAWYINKAKGILQPDGSDYEQCVAIRFDCIHNMKNWHDVPCSYEKIRYFMCERKVDDFEKNKTELKLFSSAIPLPHVLVFNMHGCENNVSISRYFVCDGFSDCLDGSDERTCDKTRCSHSQFKCANGKCIHLDFYCDGVLHCDDKSDETYCEWPVCEADKWQCNNKQCIYAERRCDGKPDCIDDTDEQNCVSCGANSYQCYDGSCINKHRQCDMMPDCPGTYQEDENMCSNFIQNSCEEWWLIGSRTNGMYLIKDGIKGSQSVHCQYTEKNDKVIISTSILYTPLITTMDAQSYMSYFYPDEMLKTNKYSCSQNISISCYFNNVAYKFSMGEDITNSYMDCNGRCHCKFGETFWRYEDPNKVLIDYGSITFAGRFPHYFVRKSRLRPESDESFFDVQFDPVTCTSEISRNISTQTIFLCENGHYYNYKDRCLLYVNEYKDLSGCRDLSHLQHCENVLCPDSFFKCPEGHCIAPNLVCDKKRHCINGDDELNCENLPCPGLFRCWKSNTCLSHKQVCDGIIQCPSGDDETGCGIICPPMCKCDGLVFTCHYTPEVENHNVPAKARKLDLSNSILPNVTTSMNHYPFMAELIMSNCSIEYIEPYTFKDFKNLILLDLSFNRLEKLHSYMFSGLRRLVTLILKGNNLLTTIEANTFHTLENILNLELVGFKIDKLQSDTFSGLKNLKDLNISRNGIRAVDKNAFNGLSNLLSIDLQFNKIEEFVKDVFSTLKHLTKMKTDSYKFCCLKPVSDCIPQPDDFSSCTYLMKNDVLRVFLWIIAISSLVGNVGVLSYRLFVDRKSVKKSNGFYIMNLGLSDMIMGVYLCTIAIADLSLRGVYIEHDETWRQSVTCKVAGVLAFISCEASVTFILLITIDCFLMVKFPFGTRRITPMLGRISSLASWVIIILLSIIPFLDTDYFSEDYYAQTAVCLLLPFSQYKFSGWEYSAAVFVFYNCVAFLITAYCQISIYNIGKSGSRIKVKKTQKDLDLARRLFLMVFTNFICWFPVGIMGIMAMTGQVFPSETYSWVAVFVIPVNAAINPFIYTFSSILKKQKPRILSSIKMLQISKIKRRKTDTPYDLCLASAFAKSKKDLELDHMTLKELFRSQKLQPKESYQLVKQLTESVVYLHKHSFTLRQPISPDYAVAFMEHKKIIRMKLISKVRFITKELDTSRDVEGIGNLTRQILRYTVIPEKTENMTTRL